MPTIDLFFTEGAVSLPLLILLGFSVGLLSGLLGVGGGWLITPGLNILGIPMAYCVGTGLTQMAATSLISLYKHRKNNNTDFTLGVGFGLPMVLGLQLGKMILVELNQRGNAGDVTRILYIILLSLMAINMLKKAPEENKKVGGWGLLHWGPKLYLKRSEKEVSLLFLLIIGILVGVLSGIMGVGGGFLLIPIMTSLLGISTLVAIATSLICVFFSGVSGAVMFSYANLVEWKIVGLLLLGSFVGSLIGVKGTEYVKESDLRRLFALLISFAAISTLLKQLHFDQLSSIVMFGIASGLSLYCIVIILRGRQA
jgi:uncharacterized membrane protein YfcA